jgi:hypothetical protein
MFFIYKLIKHKCIKAVSLKKLYLKSIYSQECFKFEVMQKLKFIFLFFSVLPLSLWAQELSCYHKFTPKQIQNLKVFQQKLQSANHPSLQKSTQFVPLKVHIVGNSAGVGYYSINNLMLALCEINERFASVGFHFYLAQPVTYINDDALNRADFDAIYDVAYAAKVPGMVNVYFHNAGNVWCGVYFGDLDIVLVKNSCQMPMATTLAHELGHFFGLPHTFLGWEGGNTPASADIERLDGSNCRSAGDGFCDTKADYVSQRWSCPLSYNLTDPIGQIFKPDSSLYMNYASDNCHSRFSAEQILAMQNDLLSRRISKTSAFNSVLTPPQKITPLNLDSNVNTKNTLFKWNAVPNAFAYHLQIARFGDWNFLNVDRLLTDTFAQVNLFGNWPFAWRVKAISEGNTCSVFGSIDTFYTSEQQTAVSEITGANLPSLFPNPVRKDDVLTLTNLGIGTINIYHAQGKLLHTLQAYTSGPLSIQMLGWEQGVYFVEFIGSSRRFIQRFVIQEN